MAKVTPVTINTTRLTLNIHKTTGMLTVSYKSGAQLVCREGKEETGIEPISDWFTANCLTFRLHKEEEENTDYHYL